METVLETTVGLGGSGRGGPGRPGEEFGWELSMAAS